MDSTPSSTVPRRWVPFTLAFSIAFIVGGAILSVIIGDWIALICAVGIAAAPLLAVLPKARA